MGPDAETTKFVAFFKEALEPNSKLVNKLNLFYNLWLIISIFGFDISILRLFNFDQTIIDTFQWNIYLEHIERKDNMIAYQTIMSPELLSMNPELLSMIEYVIYENDDFELYTDCGNNIAI